MKLLKVNGITSVNPVPAVGPAPVVFSAAKRKSFASDVVMVGSPDETTFGTDAFGSKKPEVAAPPMPNAQICMVAPVPVALTVMVFEKFVVYGAVKVATVMLPTVTVDLAVNVSPVAVGTPLTTNEPLT